jgi:hypothetical protein
MFMNMVWDVTVKFALPLRVRKVPGSNLGRRQVILTEVFRSIPLFLQANAGIVPEIRQWSLPYVVFNSLFGLLFTLSFGAA